MEQGLSKNMNEKIHLIKDVAIKDEQSLLGLIIQNTNPEQTQRHTGFIFIKNKVPFLAHFGTNQVVFYHEMSSNDNYAMFWLDIEKMPETTVIPLINELEQISKNQPSRHQNGYLFSANYGIVNLGGGQISNGNYIPNSNVPGDSLTCAVFVNCVFEQFDFPILDLATWEVSSEDVEWQKFIVSLLEQSSAFSSKFLEAQRSGIGHVPRIRPEQMVGACCIFDFDLVNYTSANEAGEIVKQKLEALGC